MPRTFHRTIFSRISSFIHQKPINVSLLSESLIAALHSYFSSTIESDEWFRSVQMWGEKNKKLFHNYKQHDIDWLREVTIGATIFFIEYRRRLCSSLSCIDKAVIESIPLVIKHTKTLTAVSLPHAEDAYKSAYACLRGYKVYGIFSCMFDFWYAEMIFRDAMPNREYNCMESLKYKSFNQTILKNVFLDADTACEKELKYWHG